MAAGRAFVRATCAYSVFPERIARIAATAPAAPVPEPVPEATPSRRSARRCHNRRADPAGPDLPGPDPAGPDLSVIVPVYRHWALVPDLLAALARQTPAARRPRSCLSTTSPRPPMKPPPPARSARQCPDPARPRPALAPRANWGGGGGAAPRLH